jgi:hypothetical protein
MMMRGFLVVLAFAMIGGAAAGCPACHPSAGTTCSYGSAAPTYQICTVACTAANPCNGTVVAERDVTLRVNCVGEEACKNLKVISVSNSTFVQLTCDGPFSCSAARFDIAGGINAFMAGNNAGYMTAIAITAAAGRATVVCNNACYGMYLNNTLAVNRDVSPSEIACSVADDGVTAQCGFFAVDGNWCDRGNHITTYGAHAVPVPPCA